MADVLVAKVKIKLFGKLQYHFIVPETGWGLWHEKHARVLPPPLL